MEDKIRQLENVKEDLLTHISRIGNYHEVDIETQYYTMQNIENIYNWCIEFYKYGIDSGTGPDNTSKKAAVISLFDNIGNMHIPIVTNFMCESPIEYLMLSELQLTMPDRIWKNLF